MWGGNVAIEEIAAGLKELRKNGSRVVVHDEWFRVKGSTENMKETLKYLNLYKFAGAVMYIMKEVLGLDEADARGQVRMPGDRSVASA